MNEFQAWLHANDFRPSEIVLDGKIKRFPRNGGKDNGWLIGFVNQSPRTGKSFIVAIAGDWRAAESRWEYKPEGKGWTAEDRAVWELQLKRLREAADEERRQRQVLAAEKAAKAWARANVVGSTPYLERKQISGLHGARIEVWAPDDHKVLVPVRDLDGNLFGLQRISADGSKRFMSGQRVEAGCFVFGDLDADAVEAFLCEGWATGASIHEATGRVVVAAFNATNLVPVGLALKAKYPALLVTVAGDDDRWKPDIGNPGVEKGKKAAMAVQGALVLPRFASPDGQPTDFNDLRCREGLEAVRSQLCEEEHETEAGFIPLGYDEATHFFYHLPSKDVVKITGFPVTGMLQMAPLGYWEMRYPTKSGAPHWLKAQDEVIQASRAAGPFDSSRIRGTGVWVDDGRVVVNTGQALIVDGKPMSLTALKTSRVYVQSKHRLPCIHPDPLSAADGRVLEDACMALVWTDSQSGLLLAGWLALARVAGALPVRPHLWITGGKGTGKSTCMEQLVAPALGHYRGKLYLQGGSTEAGIRQAIKASSLPIIFDEFEATGASSRDRMEAVIELLRNAWSHTQGVVLKGSASGYAVEYQLSFAALVSSIRVTITNDADRSRFSVLELKPHGSNGAQWRALQAVMRRVDVEYGERLFARSVARLPALLAACRSIGAALAHEHGQRFGQQVGTLLAGWWTLTHDEPPTEAEAEAVARDFALEGEIEDSTPSDEDDCLTHLLTWRIQVSVGGLSQWVQVGEAVKMEGYHDALKHYGIRVDKWRLLIAEKSSELEKIYHGTRWSKAWSRSLRRLPGAKQTERLSFGSRSMKSRCTAVPLAWEGPEPKF